MIDSLSFVHAPLSVDLHYIFPQNRGLQNNGQRRIDNGECQALLGSLRGLLIMP